MTGIIAKSKKLVSVTYEGDFEVRRTHIIKVKEFTWEQLEEYLEEIGIEYINVDSDYFCFNGAEWDTNRELAAFDVYDHFTYMEENGREKEMKEWKEKLADYNHYILSKKE